MTVEVSLEESEAGLVARVLERELRRLRRRLRRLERELGRFEERYGMSTEEFLRMYREALEGRGVWRLPEEADMDAVEWYGLAMIREEVAEMARRLEKIISKIKRGA